MALRPSSLRLAIASVERFFPSRVVPWVVSATLLTVPGACDPIDAHAGVEFSPCPRTGPCKILPLGDSITAGMVKTGQDTYEYHGGYRVGLFERAVNDGKDITFVGSREPNGPEMVAGRPFPRRHEGWSGVVIQSLGRKGIKYEDGAHIVLLHVGTNDMNGKYAHEAPERLEELLEQVTSALPNALVVVSQLVPMPKVKEKVAAYNAAIEEIVAEKAREGAHVMLVDQFTGFPAAAELPDAVHPNEAGYRRMADVWYDAIAAYLPDASTAAEHQHGEEAWNENGATPNEVAPVLAKY